MKTTIVEVLVMIALGTILQGCAALPFLPMIPSLLMTAMPGKSARAQQAKPMTQDPEIQQAIREPSGAPGDRGVDITQQDRVSFQPAAEGSIAMRVGAVDMVSDVKARSVGDIVTVTWSSR